jgi:hypothetical protein
MGYPLRVLDFMVKRKITIQVWEVSVRGVII